MMPPLPGIALVLVLLALAMLAVRALQQRFHWPPELARKAVHISMGFVCLTFPWMFRSAWPVWTLAVLAAAALALVRAVPVLRKNFGSVLGGVERESSGELLFPLSVAFVFWLARGDPLLFGVPVLIMTLADATAALIGQRYGAARYETDDGWKSVEGSAAFFLVAFLCTQFALLLGTNTGRVESLLIATVMGLIVMLMEAISWRGLDNLFVPVVSYVCLVRMLKLTQTELVWRLVVLATFIAGWSLWRRQTRLTHTAAIAAGLVLYVAWAVGDWNWLLAPIATAIVYSLLCRLRVREPRPHRVAAIAAIGGVGLCWLALSQIIGTVNTVYAYGVAYSANLGMIALAHFAQQTGGSNLSVAILKAMLTGFLTLAVPYVLVWRDNANVVPLTVAAAALVIIAVLLFAFAQPSIRNCPVDANRWMRQAVIALAASGAAFGVISKLEPWSKSFL